MISDDLEIADGAEKGAWIRPRLGGEFGAVTLQVPKGFEAYARVFHPALDPEGNPVSWTDVAKACGTIPHREMQWHAILGLADTDELGGRHSPNDPNGTKWTGSDPPIGTMDIQKLDALCEILAVHTADPTLCFFGLCTIQSWLDSFSADELRPLLELPARSYIVLSGPLAAVDQLVYDWSKMHSTQMTDVARNSQEPSWRLDPSTLSQREAPNLIWPADRSWFVSSEVDFDSTLVGGSAALIEAIIGSDDLEAWQVNASDSLAIDADRLNVPKDR